MPPRPPLEHGAELRRELVRGQPVERDGREPVELRCRPGRVGLALDQDDRAEPLAVEDDRGIAADEPHVTSRQADERVGRDDGEAAAAVTASSPVTAGVPAPGRTDAPDAEVDDLRARGGETSTSPAATAP